MPTSSCEETDTCATCAVFINFKISLLQTKNQTTMKFAAVTLALVGSASAFAPSKQSARSVVLGESKVRRERQYDTFKPY
jgi:hypothetical protein